jgi:hypothetical protein
VTSATKQNWRGKKHYESLSQLSKIYFQFHASIFSQRWVFLFIFSSIIFCFKYNNIYGESHSSLHCNLEEINLKVWKPKGWRNSWFRLLTNLHIFNHLNESFFESIMHLWCLKWKEVNILSWSISWQKSFNFLKNHDLRTNFCMETTCKIVRAL